MPAFLSCIAMPSPPNPVPMIKTEGNAAFADWFMANSPGGEMIEPSVYGAISLQWMTLSDRSVSQNDQ
jgi:hypothetical protein